MCYQTGANLKAHRSQIVITKSSEKQHYNSFFNKVNHHAIQLALEFNILYQDINLKTYHPIFFILHSTKKLVNKKSPKIVLPT